MIKAVINLINENRRYKACSYIYLYFRLNGEFTETEYKEFCPGVSEKYEEHTYICRVVTVNGRNEFIFEKKQVSMAIEVKKNYNMASMVLNDIDEKYAWARFGNVEVIMMKENGYINATKLCKLGGKNFRDWYRGGNKNYVEFIENQLNEASANLRYPIKSLILVKDGNNNEIRGTYAHPKIIVSVASWISHEFNSMVSDIVLNFFAEQRTAALKKEITVKDDKIDNLTNVVNIQTKKIDEQSLKIDELLYQAKSMNNKLDFVKQEYVVPAKKEDNNIFTLFVNFDDAPPEGIEKAYKYTVIRCMHKSYLNCFKRHRAKYPQAKKLFELVDPYANNLWNRIKVECGLDTSYASFNLPENYDEMRLLNDIRSNADLRFSF